MVWWIHENKVKVQGQGHRIKDHGDQPWASPGDGEGVERGGPWSHEMDMGVQAEEGLGGPDLQLRLELEVRALGSHRDSCSI